MQKRGDVVVQGVHVLHQPLVSFVIHLQGSGPRGSQAALGTPALTAGPENKPAPRGVGRSLTTPTPPELVFPSPRKKLRRGKGGVTREGEKLRTRTSSNGGPRDLCCSQGHRTVCIIITFFSNTNIKKTTLAGHNQSVPVFLFGNRTRTFAIYLSIYLFCFLQDARVFSELARSLPFPKYVNGQSAVLSL